MKLPTDPTQDRAGTHGRLLAYVRIVATAKDLRAQQVAAGWSPAYVFEQPFQKLDVYRAKEEAAKAAGRGVWGACGGDFHRAI